MDTSRSISNGRTNAQRNVATKITTKKPKRKCSKKYELVFPLLFRHVSLSLARFQDEFDAYILNRLSDIIHSLLVTYTDSYLVYFDTLVQHFHALLQSTRSVSDRQWALCVFDDVVQFTGAHSHRYSQLFLGRMADSLADSSAEVFLSRSRSRSMLDLSRRFDKLLLMVLA